MIEHTVVDLLIGLGAILVAIAGASPFGALLVGIIVEWNETVEEGEQPKP